MRRLILGFALLAPVVAVLLWSTSIVAALGVIFVSHMLVLYPTLRARSGWLGPVITSFHTDANEVWLTIDDGPDAEDTPVILEILRSHDAHATFFVKGKNVRALPDLARRIVAEGHTLGNHSDTHPSGSFWCLSPGRIAREIDGCNAAIEEATGVRPSLFRAPVGMKNPFVHPLLERRGMPLVGWSSRGFDGVHPEAGQVVSRIMKDIAPGAIVLLHEGKTGRDGSRVSPEIIGSLLQELDSRGYRCVIPAVAALI